MLGGSLSKFSLGSLDRLDAREARLCDCSLERSIYSKRLILSNCSCLLEGLLARGFCCTGVGGEVLPVVQ